MFAGKTVVITGGAAGIGKSLAEKMLAEKAIVWAWDRDANALEQARGEAAKFGLELFTAVVDVTDTEAMAKAAKEVIAKTGRIHVWVNNAGISGLGDFLKTPTKDFERVLDVNLHAVIRGTRIALTHMEEQGGGTIVNMASVAGFLPAPYMSAYCTTKHAVVGFTRALREELRLKDSAVKVLMVSPGFVATAMVLQGEQFGFPGWLDWMLSDVNQVAREIMVALRKGRDEVTPTWNGRLMMEMNKWMPRTARRGAKVFLTRSFKDLVMRRYTVS